ncbi:hypothetical protein PCANC_20762 [Puccinia coronata f. sp. avenae]|uniref:Uncharacterized protein n=1 Tax=Puccinia coronata f. sp. avenae TaxID=200324 RepID=A0A2N5U6L6_9BASI|nr:hypothetical protein PCANC_20762 [Puccinia coronata f. sp. avenae]
MPIGPGYRWAAQTQSGLDRFWSWLSPEQTQVPRRPQVPRRRVNNFQLVNVMEPQSSPPVPTPAPAPGSDANILVDDSVSNAPATRPASYCPEVPAGSMIVPGKHQTQQATRRQPAGSMRGLLKHLSPLPGVLCNLRRTLLANNTTKPLADISLLPSTSQARPAKRSQLPPTTSRPQPADYSLLPPTTSQPQPANRSLLTSTSRPQPQTTTSNCLVHPCRLDHGRQALPAATAHQLLPAGCRPLLADRPQPANRSLLPPPTGQPQPANRSLLPSASQPQTTPTTADSLAHLCPLAHHHCPLPADAPKLTAALQPLPYTCPPLPSRSPPPSAPCCRPLLAYRSQLLPASTSQPQPTTANSLAHLCPLAHHHCPLPAATVY